MPPQPNPIPHEVPPLRASVPSCLRASPRLTFSSVMARHPGADGALERKRWAAWFGCSPETTYHWSQGRNSPQIDAVAVAFPKLPPALQDDVLQLIIGGRSIAFYRTQFDDEDLVTAQPVRDYAIQVPRKALDFLKAAQDLPSVLTSSEYAAFAAAAAEVRRAIDQTLCFVAPRRVGR